MLLILYSKTRLTNKLTTSPYACSYIFFSCEGPWL